MGGALSAEARQLLEGGATGSELHKVVSEALCLNQNHDIVADKSAKYGAEVGVLSILLHRIGVSLHPKRVFAR